MIDIITYIKRLTTESKKNRDGIQANKAQLTSDAILALIDKPALLQALQGAGLNLSLYNEFKGSLSTAPSGTHVNGDYYFNTTDDKLYVYHDSSFHAFGGSSAITKDVILNQLGLSNDLLTTLKTLAGGLDDAPLSALEQDTI